MIGGVTQEQHYYNSTAPSKVTDDDYSYTNVDIINNPPYKHATTNEINKNNTFNEFNQINETGLNRQHGQGNPIDETSKISLVPNGNANENRLGKIQITKRHINMKRGQRELMIQQVPVFTKTTRIQFITIQLTTCMIHQVTREKEEKEKTHTIMFLDGKTMTIMILLNVHNVLISLILFKRHDISLLIP